MKSEELAPTKHSTLFIPYDDCFYDSISEHSLVASSVILPLIDNVLRPQSIVDFGCGRGAWLLYWENQAREVLGLDGDYVDRQKLLIREDHFEPNDITIQIRLKRRFDLALCLEVAEHIPTAASEVLVDNLTDASEVILFSAAPPGQGGTGHVNEQTYEFWRELFIRRGYEAYDYIRPQIRGSEIQKWYLYNPLLYVKSGHDLQAKLAAFYVPESEDVQDVSDFLWKLRKFVLKFLSPRVITKLAILKHRFFN